MSTEESSTSGADVAAPAAPELRLSDVERALGPLRRCVAYAAKQPQNVRYLEATCMQWVERAVGLPLPVSVAVDLAEVGRQLVGIDALEGEERVVRIGEVNALVARVDGLLGLPLDRLRFRRARTRVYPRRQEELPEPTPEPSSEAPKPPETAEHSAADTEAEAPPPEKKERRKRIRKPERIMQRDEGPPPPPSLPSGPWSYGHGIGGVSLSKRGLPEDLVSKLAKASIETSTDLFRLQPSGYETLRPVHGAGRAIEPGRAAVGGRIRARFTVLGPGGSAHSEAVIRGADVARLVFPDRVPEALYNELSVGTRVVGVGEVASPEDDRMQRVHDVELTAGLTQKLAELPSYDVDGVADRDIRRALRAVLSDAESLRDPLSDEDRAANDLIGLGEALIAVHAGSQQRRAGWKRLAFDEATYAQLGLALTRTAPEQATARRGIAHPVLHRNVSRLTTWRDIDVDDAHFAAFELIKRELRNRTPMLRVLAGRPGDQRERVALLSAVTVAESKSQVLWLFPEPAMAEALYTQYEPILRELGLVSRLVPDDPSRGVRDGLRRGEIHVTFGSLALAKAGLQLRRLGLVIAHEANPGEVDHSGLVDEGTPAPDFLVVPARAIGAGHLLGPYAEYAVSWVQPHKWPRFQTALISASERETAYEELRQAIDDGAQAMIVLPMGRTGDLLEPEEAVRVRTTMESHLPGATIQLFHGALSREERNRRFEDFQRRRFEVLLATHAVEYGGDTPGATELVVEQADRMPRERLSRLMHRLVGLQSPNVRLIHGQDPDPSGMAVLELLKRGRIDDALSGDTFTTAEPKLSWMDAGRDVDLLLASREVALAALKADPQLKHAKSRGIAHALSVWWPSLFSSECPVDTPKPAAPTSGRRRRRRRRRR